MTEDKPMRVVLTEKFLIHFVLFKIHAFIISEKGAVDKSSKKLIDDA